MSGGMRGFADLLAEILQMAHKGLVVEQKVLNSIFIWDSASMEEKIKSNHLPSMIITPLVEDHEPGPFTDSARQLFTLRIRLIAKSQDPQSFMVGQGILLTNIFELNYRTRELFYKNKTLNHTAFEMRPGWKSKFINVVSTNKSGIFTALDTILTYTKLEAYSGMQNKQDSLVPPFQFT